MSVLAGMAVRRQLSVLPPLLARKPVVGVCDQTCSNQPGLEVIKLESILRLKIKRTDWLLADTCPQAANHCALF